MASSYVTDTISYDLKSSSDDAAKNDNAVWSFSADELQDGGTTKSIGVLVEDYTDKTHGAYDDTLTFSIGID